MSNVDLKAVDIEPQLKLDLGEPPREINDRNEEAELARRAARFGGYDDPEDWRWVNEYNRGYVHT